MHQIRDVLVDGVVDRLLVADNRANTGLGSVATNVASTRHSFGATIGWCCRAGTSSPRLLSTRGLGAIHRPRTFLDDRKA